MDIKFQQTPNYALGAGIKKRGYVLHQTLGAFSGAVEWLMNPNRPNRSSAHYVIGRNEGEVVQLVKVEDVAWHAGNISNPSIYAKSGMLKNADGTYVNPNKYLIGIEFTSRYDINHNGHIEPEEIDINDWQYRCAMMIFEKNKEMIPVIKTLFLPSHKEIADYKSDDTIFIREGLLKRLFASPEEEMVCLQVKKKDLEKIQNFIKSL